MASKPDGFDDEDGQRRLEEMLAAKAAEDALRAAREEEARLEEIWRKSYG